MPGRRRWTLALASLVALALAGSLIAAWALADPGSPEGERASAVPARTTQGSVSPAPTSTPPTRAPTQAPTQSPGRARAGTSTGATMQAPGPEPARGPVVVVPGYGGQTALLRPLVGALRRDGRSVRVLRLGNPTANLNAQARVLEREVDRLIGDGAPSVDLIGFSAGGLVARIWAEGGGTAVARRVVTLGAPHQGSEVAELARLFLPRECPASCRQLSPGSALLRRLGESAPGPRWVSVWTRTDRISTPPTTAVLAGALNIAVQDLCPGARVAHGMLPRTDFVVDLVVAALDSAEPLVSPPAPGGPNCPAPS